MSRDAVKAPQEPDLEIPKPENHEQLINYPKALIASHGLRFRV